MAKKNHMHVVTASMSLELDPGIPVEDLVRTLTEWKRMKDGGRTPPQWGCREAPKTLEGFLRLLTRADVPGTNPMTEILHRCDGGIVDCVAMFEAPAGWPDVMVQAFSSMAYGLRPGSDMAVSWGYSESEDRMWVHHREFKVVLNGDGEPEVEEVPPQ